MAVTAPTPPTPPTPPTVPQVTMDGGGTVTETTSPGTAISNLEAQARAAVARGEGALTRVMNGDGDGSDGSDGSNASNTSTSNASIGTNGSNGNGTNAQAGQQKSGQQQGTQNAQQGAQVVAADGAGNPLAGQGDDAQSAKAMQALEEGRVHSQSSALGGHGALYIGFSIVAFVVLAVVAFRWFRIRRKERGSLHFGDFADEGSDWRTHAAGGRSARDHGTEEQSDGDASLRGRTAGEILGDIEREEERQLAIARKRAEEYKRQQARDAAARERRKEEREEEAARKAREALRAQTAQERKQSVIKAKKDEDNQPHFDLRA